VIDGVQCMVEICDTAGQEEYTALRDQWIRDGEAFVLVYGIGNRSSFNRISRFHDQIHTIKGEKGDEQRAMILVGHDYDEDSVRAEREVSREEGSALAKELQCEFIEASARHCINVENAFYAVVRELRRQRANRMASMPSTREQQIGGMNKIANWVVSFCQQSRRLGGQ
jgi:GTPase KRas